MRDEQLSFRIRDNNGSTFLVEEWIDTNTNQTANYRIGVEVRGEGVNYFYANPGQYELFIQSEYERLSDKGAVRR